MTLARAGSWIATLAAVLIWSGPVFAQRDDGSHRDRSGQSERDRGGQVQHGGRDQRGGQQPRSGPDQRSGQPQRAEPRSAQGANQGGEQRRAEPRQPAPQPAAPRAGEQHGAAQHGTEQRGVEQRGAASRGEAPRATAPRGDERRAVPRGRAVPPNARAYREPRTYGYDRPPRARVPVVVYPRPYYVFRPRYRIGFGIYIGIGVPYPVAYGVPTYVYGYPAPYGAPAPGSYGGISFEVTPDDAAVSIDGAWVGEARDFSPSHEPLTVTPGRHHIELQADSMPPVAFDVDVIGGEVTPFRGSLLPY